MNGFAHKPPCPYKKPMLVLSIFPGFLSAHAGVVSMTRPLACERVACAVGDARGGCVDF